MSKLPNYLARAELQRSDWRIMRAVEREFASPEWCEWRDKLRRLVGMVDGFDELPPEPPFGKHIPSPPPVKTAPEPEAPLLPAPDALMSDYGPVGEGYDDVTGDMLLDAFEQDEAEAVAVIQVLSATRQRHLSEQLNVEKARLRREHMLTDQANPREASIDRLLGLLTRRGD
jgi:hypothetical protein